MDRPGRRVDRRTLLREGMLAGGALMAAGGTLAGLAQAGGTGGAAPANRHRPVFAPREQTRPNILVILVDQLRSTPQWLSQSPIDARTLPNIASLARTGITFANHHTASNDCTPARSTLLTGLYTHQTGCMVTGGSTLSSEFPTWGTMLREQDYETWWFGKWHLTRKDGKWTPGMSPNPMEAYGFSGGTFPSPNGGPGQGWREDPHITDQFRQWYAEAPSKQPWCTTVSLVNPHDIAWWYMWSDRLFAESTSPKVVHELPPNFETPEMLEARNKPALQRTFQETSALSFGPVPFTGRDVKSSWMPFLDLYAKLQGEVDSHVGTVLRTLASRPQLAANTVILFSSDHGEYGAAHGLRGKGASAYEEGIRVPLIVNDRRGLLNRAPKRLRYQLTSSVDVAPLLLTIASGSNHWRKESQYAHLANRADLSKMLVDPGGPGRQYILHATDEIVTEFAIEPYAAYAPLHVIAIRTHQGKYAIYSNWEIEGTVPVSKGEQVELYDYRTRSGRLELHNSAGHSPLEQQLRSALHQAVSEEMRGELPSELVFAQVEGFSDYFATAKRAARTATRRRNNMQKLIQIR